MKSITFGVTLIALVSSAQAEPVGEPLRTHLIAGWMKYCTGTFDTPGNKKSWTPKEISDFCACGSVTMADRTTKEMYEARQRTGEYAKEWWDMREDVRLYCTDKYVKTPNVDDIKDKKW